MTNQPNILFIMTDQQRADALGCTGGWVETPHLDRIAGEGVLFENCVTTSPVCVPARLSLATGRYPHSTTVWNNGSHTLGPNIPTWMKSIRDQGYRTSLFGKTHLHASSGDLRDDEDLLHDYGWADVVETNGPRACANGLSHLTARWEALGLWNAYRADVKDRFATKPHVVRPTPLPLDEYYDVYVGRKAKDYLREYDRDEPWLCCVSFGGPHEPWDTPEPYANRYDPAVMPRPIPRDSVESQIDRPKGLLDQRLADRPKDLTDKDIAAMRANYAGNITLIDDQIGQILETVKERGEWGNTVIAFTSDHGEHNGDHGLIYKSTFYDAAVRVPLIVRTPKTAKTGASRSQALVEWFDVGPTLLELAGGSVDYPQSAQSLVPSLEDPTKIHRPFVISEIQREVMYLDHQWKAALNKEGELYLLFNREEDPQELENLAGHPDHAEVETRIRLQLLKRILSSQIIHPKTRH